MADDTIEFPILDFTEDRLVDGDTRALVTKINNQQLKLETWSEGANALRQIQYDNTGLPLSGGTMIGKIYGPQTELTDPGTTLVTKYFADSTYVNRFTSQTISGQKIFNSPIVFNDLVTINDALIKSAQELDVGSSIVVLNSDETGSPTVDAGIEIERGNQTNARLVWDESSDRFQAGLTNNLKNIAVEGDFVNLTTNQNIYGIKILNDNPVINSPSGNPAITFKRNNVNSDIIFSLNSNLLLRHQHTSGGTDTELRLYDNYINVNKEIRGVQTVSTNGASTLTSKGYVDDLDSENVKLTGTQEIAGNKRFIGYTTANATLQVNGNITSSGNVVNFAKHARAPNIVPSNALDYSPKGYVDQFLKLTGGTITGNTTLSNSNPYFTINSTDEGNAHLQFQNEGVRSALIYSSATSTSFRRYTGTTAGTNFTLFDNLATLDVALRTPSTQASDVGTTVATKDYVDNVAGGGGGSYVDLSSDQNIDGKKTFEDDVVVESSHLRVHAESPWLTITGTTPGHQGNVHLQFKSTTASGDDQLSGLLYHESSSNSLRLRKYNREDGTNIQSEIVLFPGYIQSQSPIRLNATPENRDDAVLRRIDADNRYVQANNLFRATDNGSSNNLNQSTAQNAALMANVIFNDNSMVSVSNGSTATINQSGRYKIRTNVYYKGVDQRVSISVRVYINGISEGTTAISYLRFASGHDHDSVGLSDQTFNLAAGDTVEIRTQQTATAGVATFEGTGGSYIEIEKV